MSSCGTCGGTGSLTVTCTGCNGLGVGCPLCNGSGHKTVSCRNCNGTGQK